MLNNQQLNFCREIVSGKSQTDAYLSAYPSCKSRDSARAAAPRLLAKVSVRSKIRELRDKVDTEHVLSWLDKRQILASMIMDFGLPNMVVLRAIELDNKMAGHDKPPAPEGNSQLDELLAMIRSQKD